MSRIQNLNFGHVEPINVPLEGGGWTTLYVAITKPKSLRWWEKFIGREPRKQKFRLLGDNHKLLSEDQQKELIESLRKNGELEE